MGTKGIRYDKVWPADDLIWTDMQIFQEGDLSTACSNESVGPPPACFNQSVNFTLGMEVTGEILDYKLFTDFNDLQRWIADPKQNPPSHPHHPFRHCLYALMKSRLDGSKNNYQYHSSNRSWHFNITFEDKDQKLARTVIGRHSASQR